MIESILIANRGEIACRIIRACRRLGIRPVAVFSDADKNGRHVQMAGEALYLGPAPAADSYLAADKIIEAARKAGVTAMHPGFGFLAENAPFAQACIDAGLIFIGPAPRAIALMGDKQAARKLVTELGLPVIPGTMDGGQTDEALQEAAEQLGCPLLVKAAAGGGGKGMRRVDDLQDLPQALAGARREAEHAFGSSALLLEKVIPNPRHVEIQILGDRLGQIIHLGERECSIQRRYQKIVEEAPSTAVSPELRSRMGAAAVAIAQAVNYEGAGTVEFLLDQNGDFYFLEMNTRLQVEHPVTEMISGIDLVEWQIRVAEGQALPWDQDSITFSGHAVEARIYAENPAKGFLPATGEILLWQEPAGEGIRVESGILAKDQVSRFYDPLLVKIIAHAPDRPTAVRRLARSLQETTLLGVDTNLSFLKDLLGHPAFLAGETHTQFVDENYSGWQSPPVDHAPGLLALALAQFQIQSAGSEHAGYWRNNPNSPQMYRFKPADQEDFVEVGLRPERKVSGRYHMHLSTVAGHIFLVDLVHCELPEIILIVDGYRQQVTAVSSDDTWWLKMRQGVVKIEAVPLLPRPRPPADAGGSLRAPMPGVILELLVTEGEQVAEGQALLKLEAMKMEHTIKTAAAGIVGKIFYQPGDTVEADAQLLIIDSES